MTILPNWIFDGNPLSNPSEAGFDRDIKNLQSRFGFDRDINKSLNRPFDRTRTPQKLNGSTKYRLRSKINKDQELFIYCQYNLPLPKLE